MHLICNTIIHKIKMYSISRPWILLYYRFRKSIKNNLFNNNTDLLIEGFPRSANSFALNAFKFAQKEPVQVASHLHAPAHVLRAVKVGTLALVLIRNPEDAVLSLLLMSDSYDIPKAIEYYINFYKPLVSCRDQFVLATFDEITTDFGQVIRRINDRYATAFIPYQHTEENVNKVLDVMGKYFRERHVNDRLAVALPGPSEKKLELKKKRSVEFKSALNQLLLKEAVSLYNQMVSC